jgi:transcriptional regulator with XRE-family HTH domain
MPANSEFRGTPTIRGLGATIRRRREERDLTQDHLAERARLHSSYVSFLENGRRYPCWNALCALSAALEIKLSILIREAEEL